MHHLRSFWPVLLAFLATPVSAADWPPADPGERQARAEFTVGWAASLRGLRDFRQLQSAAGAGGKITEIVLDGDAPHVVFDWIGARGNGRMRAMLYKTGDFGVTLRLAAAAEPIVLNNFGAFVCSACSPPVNACGRRPSWIARDLHWDNFDCRCTLTGPQPELPKSC